MPPQTTSSSTTTSTTLYGDCNGYCTYNNYYGGLCRGQQRECLQNLEKYEPAANTLCPAELNACCCKPKITTTQVPPIKTTSTTQETTTTTNLPTITTTTIKPTTSIFGCFNGFRDGDEDGVDCGGGCWSPCDYSRPQLVVGGPMLLQPNTTAEFKVTDQFGTEVGQTNVALRNPQGDVVVVSTNEYGQFNITEALAGMWKLTAVKDGYEPGTKNTLAIDITSPEVIAAVVVVVGSTTLLPYIVFWFLFRRRRGTLVSPDAIKFLAGSEFMRSTKTFLTLSVGSELYPELVSSGKLQTVKVSSKDLSVSSDIKSRYGLADDLCLVFAIAKNMRVKKLIVSSGVSPELKAELGKLVILTLDEL